MEFSKCKPSLKEGAAFEAEPEIEWEMATYRFYYTVTEGGPELMIQYYPEI